MSSLPIVGGAVEVCPRDFMNKTLRFGYVPAVTGYA